MAQDNTNKFDRRDLLQATGAGLGTVGIISFSGCTGNGGNGSQEGNGSSDGDSSTDGDGSSGDESDGDDSTSGDGEDAPMETIEAPYVVSENSLDMVPFQLGQEDGIFAEHGIELNIEITSYGEYSRALTTGDSNFGNADQSMFVDAHNSDFEQVAFGSNLLQLNSIFVREDSDIESVADLEGRSVGVPFWESGTTLGMRAVIQDEFGFSLREDTDGTAVAPPVLEQLLLDGEIDAAVQFTGFTISGFVNDDLRSIFDIAPFWEERTGHPLVVAYFAARQGWLEENWDVAYRFTQAWNESLDALSENPQEAYDRLGLLAGLDSEEKVEFVSNAFNDGRVHQPTQSNWTEEFVDAQYQFLELLDEYGLKEEIPPREKMISHSELADNADQ
jgi:NitT/TauT family transport system substrate-binding protein